MTTSESLRSYSPERRQCYFSYERYLRHFQIYTERNCELECIKNFTLKECGCVALHMPRSEDEKICGAGSKDCMVKAGDLLKRLEIEASFKNEVEDYCNCLPSCSSIRYDAETTQASYDAIGALRAFNDDISEFEGTEIARISLFYKETQFTTSRRSELFGVVDFLANCGGLLGLFCGISLLSLIEIIYFLTLRLWNNIKRIKTSMNVNTDVEADPGKNSNFNNIELSKVTHED